MPGCRATAISQRKKKREPISPKAPRPVRWATALSKGKAAGRPLRHCMRLPSGTVHGISNGKPFSLAVREGCPQHAAHTTLAFYRRKRGMARRRSPPRRGGSSDAARTLVTRKRGTAGGRCPMPRGREEAGGLLEQIDRLSRMAAPTRGWGSWGVRGCASPLPHLCCRCP